jgi:hypothetical protein
VLGATIISTHVVVMIALRLNNLNSSRLFSGFNNCHFWHFWWNCVELSLITHHYMVTHWYLVWCRMWMCIHLRLFVLELNGWMNLSTL